MKQENKLLSIIGNLDICIAAVALIVLVFLTSTGVVMRYVVSKPFTWLEEVQLFCMVWIVFGAGGAAFRTGSHVAIEMVVEMFPKPVQNIISIFVDIVVLLVIGYLLKQSIGFVQIFLGSGRSTSLLKIPYSLIYGIAPVSYVIMIVSYFTCKYTNKWKSKNIEEEVAK